MSREIILSPEKLYFLGTLMNAKYIDYSYIASMREIQRNYEIVKSKCMLDLSREGLIREKLSGEIIIRPQVECLLKNIFFGTLETTLDVITIGDHANRSTYNFHYLNGTITMVTYNQDALTVVSTTEVEQEKLIHTIVGRHITSKQFLELVKEDVTKVIIAKRAMVGTGSTELLLLEQDKGLYTLDSFNKLINISDEKAVEKLLAMLKGE